MNTKNLESKNDPSNISPTILITHKHYTIIIIQMNLVLPIIVTIIINNSMNTTHNFRNK